MNLAARSVTFWDVPMRRCSARTSRRGSRRCRREPREGQAARPRPGHHPDPLQQRAGGAARGGQGPDHRGRPERRRPTPPHPPRGVPWSCRRRRRCAALPRPRPTRGSGRSSRCARSPGYGSAKLPRLQAGDFDLRARQTPVRRQVQREVAAGVEIRPPKYGSERTVHLADGLVDDRQGAPDTRCPARDRALAVPRRERQPAAPEHGRLLVAQDAHGGRLPDRQAARPPALLRLGPDRRRLRRRHRPARPRARQRDHHARRPTRTSGRPPRTAPGPAAAALLAAVLGDC